MIGAMVAEDDGSVWVALELQAGGARMSGALYDESGAEYHFESWLELLTLLEAAHVTAGRAEAAGR